eukprot:622914-Hanusia_phi.AAC.1
MPSCNIRQGRSVHEDSQSSCVPPEDVDLDQETSILLQHAAVGLCQRASSNEAVGGGGRGRGAWKGTVRVGREGGSKERGSRGRRMSACGC